MNQKEILKKLEEIEKTVKTMIAELKGNQKQQAAMGPLQIAVKTITSSSSSTEDIKQALQFLCQSPEPLSVKQVAFCTFYSLLNKTDAIGEDVDRWLNIQIGKHKYNERTDFIQKVQDIIEENYNARGNFKQKIKGYLDSKKK